MKRASPARSAVRILPTPFIPPRVNALGRHLARDDEWLPETVAGLHSVACACLILGQRITVAGARP